MSQLDQATSKDYYKCLGLTAKASPQHICQAYQQLALMYHPSLHHSNQNSAYHHFCQASEAFDVLYDSEKRKIYDTYGEQKLKEGVFQNGALVGKYKFTADPEETFEKFFGSKNVFEHLLEVGSGKGVSHPIFKAQYPTSIEKVIPNLVVPVHCTLSELYNGCTKEISYEKQILSNNGKNSITVVETKKISIIPGSSAKTPLVFENQGHCEPGQKPSQLIFNLIEVNEKNFKRDNDNLIYTAKVSLIDALDAKSITITELNGQILQLHFDEIISPQTRRLIHGKGMPIRQNAQKQGDLIVKFDIQFPQELSPDKKQKIVQLLRQ